MKGQLAREPGSHQRHQLDALDTGSALVQAERGRNGDTDAGRHSGGECVGGVEFEHARRLRAWRAKMPLDLRAAMRVRFVPNELMVREYLAPGNRDRGFRD